MRILDVVLIFIPVVSFLSERQYGCVVCLLAEEVSFVLFVFQNVPDGGSFPERILSARYSVFIEQTGDLVSRFPGQIIREDSPYDIRFGFILYEFSVDQAESVGSVTVHEIAVCHTFRIGVAKPD